ncbi:alcohol dehydrogenase 1-like [Musca vetustissima]|uniref:alcohol dehydrogenase 1-like n=1 Tax=Musca vetustissima TaxID=27455 RepID=UPI002AB6D9AB|nr:alcohol dehydrogenase 1-like [Musca vetustissima]
MKFKGICVIYIGGFGGIGQKCIEELLKEEIGHMFLFDVVANDEYLDKFQKEFSNSKIEFVPVDMSKVETIENAYKIVMDKIGHIDIVINGSGILNERLIDLTVAVNLTGVIHSNLIALNHMSKANGGLGGIIVNIASVAGLEPMAIAAVYSATKSAVISFSKTMANPCYYEHTGVSFITICPGSTTTNIIRDLSLKSTFPQYYEEIKETMENHSKQSPEKLAKAFVRILEIADNGTLWTVIGGKFEKVDE